MTSPAAHRRAASAVSGWHFLPFALVGALHLVGQLAALDWLQIATKPLIVPGLALALLLSARGRSGQVLVVTLVALGFGWIGDLALANPGEIWFLVGLGSFLIGHVVYIVLFLRYLGRGRLPWSALALIGPFIALLLVLAPHLGGLLVPVAVYAAVITTMAITATRCSPIVAVGAALFMISDSLLALDRFLPHAEIWQSGFLIMLSYIAAQGLITLGVARRASLPA